MKTSLIYSGTSSGRLLIRLMAAHLIGTAFAYTIYINLSSLGDGYAPEDFSGFDQKFSSTVLVHSIYAFLGIFFPGFLAPLFLGQVVAIVTWRAFRDVYNRINPRLFWACNLVPHFLVWSGSSSKEQIVIICGIIVIDFSTKYLFIARKLKIDILWVLISLWFIYFIRPNYFVIYCTIFLSSIFFSSTSKTMTKRLSVGIWLMAYLIISLGLIIILLLDTKFISEDVVRYMKIVEGSFLAYDGGSNRTDIQWNNFTDFIYSAPWGILQGFIGPTLPEVIKKPLQFPVFIEGLVYLWILIYLFFKLFKLAGAINILRVQILPYMFIVLIIVLVSYPYLIFNPGSALRYKQSMHPILIFYPLLILAYARANNFMKTNARQKLFDRTRFIQ